MADISKIVLPDSSSYDLISKRTRGIYRGQIESTSTATNFTVTIDGITEYYDGLTLSIRNPVITSAANCTLNVNNLGAKRIWASQQNTFVSTSILKGAQFLFTYDGINDRWIKQQGTQTTNSNTVGEYAGSCIAGPFGMARYCLIMKVDDQHWESLVKTSGTGVSKEKNLHGFLLRSPVLYQSGGTYTQGKSAAQSGCWSTAYFDTRYSTNAGSFSTAGKSFYLVGTIVDEEYFYLSDTWWADSLPNEEDGKVYIYIGQMYSAYQCTLAPKHPIYIYKNNELIQLIVPSDGSLIKNIPVNSTKKKQGSICSFFDPVGELPLKELTVNIDPVQDLHGYDSPWASGGKGNLLPSPLDDSISSNGITLTVKNGVYTITGTPTQATYILFDVDEFVIPVGGDTNKLYLFNTTADSSVYFLLFNGDTQVERWQVSPANRSSTYSGMSGKTVNKLGVLVNGSTAVSMTFSPAIISASETNPQFYPYSNICPITGRSEANVVACGKNLYGGAEMMNGFYAVGKSATKDETVHTVAFGGISGKPTVFTMPFAENTQYTFIFTLANTLANTGTNIIIVYTNGTFSYINKQSNTNKQTIVFISNANRTVEKISLVNAGGITTVYCDECGVFEGVLTADQFEPYHGTSITIDFGRTVYGGVLNVLSGKLSINRLLYKGGWRKYNENENYNIYRQTFPLASPTPKHMSNVIAIFRSFSSSTVSENIIQPPTSSGGNGYMALRKDLSADDVEYSYVIATPIEIQLDPHEVSSLLRQNNIYADTGDTSIEYIANNGVIIPDASLTRPGLMTISDKEKINQINNIYEEIDNTKNHIIFSKTQPVNQQAGDIWVIIK